MHFLGGVVVMLGLYTLNDLNIVVKEKHLRLPLMLFLVFFIAIVWEVYEILIGIPIEDDYVIDTFTDLCMGIGGALLGYSIAKNLKKL